MVTPMADTAPAFLFVAEHPALDFVNTAYGTGGEARDTLGRDADVVAWLQAAGLLEEEFGEAPKGLARLAHELRDAASRLVREPGQPRSADLAVVDRIREQGRPRLVLQLDKGAGRVREVQCRRDDGRASLLEPVASALAGLLAGPGLERVRACEAHDCTLVFEDTTRSGRRRWCSMALCGNRMKVAAFRSRRREGAGS